MRNPFRYFNSSPEVIRLTVMMYIRYPLSLRQVDDLLFERGIDICHETVRFWWNRFGPMFAAEIRKRTMKRHGRPKAIVTDRLRSYRAAMAKFGDIKTLQMFTSVHAPIHNHFNPDRHRNRRDIFKQTRSSALAEWRELLA